MLSPRGVVSATHAPSHLSSVPRDTRNAIIMCDRCHHALERKQLPQFAIANGFAIGQLPEHLRNASSLEFALVRSAHSARLVRVASVALISRLVSVRLSLRVVVTGELCVS